MRGIGGVSDDQDSSAWTGQSLELDKEQTEDTRRYERNCEDLLGLATLGRSEAMIMRSSAGL
jgi:hypothetical protein